MNLLWEREKQPLASRNCFGPYNWVSVFFCWTQPILHQTSFTSSLNGWRQNRFTPYHVLTKIQMWILYKPQNDLGKAMAPHPRTFAWKIQWTEEPGGLQSMVSLRVGHGWATSLSLFTFTFHFHALGKEMATHSSILAQRIPGMGEPGDLPSMGSHRVGHDWRDLAAALAGAKWLNSHILVNTMISTS